MEIARLRQ